MSATVTTEIPTGTWSVDPIHSSIAFGVKHLGVSTFRGDFNYSGLGVWQNEKGVIYFTQIFVKLRPPAPASPPVPAMQEASLINLFAPANPRTQP